MPEQAPEVINYWYSKTMHAMLREPRLFSDKIGYVQKLPDGKIGTVCSRSNEHGCGWDDIRFVGSYSSYGIPVPATSIHLEDDDA